jgi:hypothetical protein
MTVHGESSRRRRIVLWVLVPAGMLLATLLVVVIRGLLFFEVLNDAMESRLFAGEIVMTTHLASTPVRGRVLAYA